jgi:hypothetical protein
MLMQIPLDVQFFLYRFPQFSHGVVNLAALLGRALFKKVDWVT